MARLNVPSVEEIKQYKKDCKDLRLAAKQLHYIKPKALEKLRKRIQRFNLRYGFTYR